MESFHYLTVFTALNPLMIYLSMLTLPYSVARYLEVKLQLDLSWHN